MVIWSAIFTGGTDGVSETYNIFITGSADEDQIKVELYAEVDGCRREGVSLIKKIDNLSVTKWDPGSTSFLNCLLAGGAATLAGELAKCQQKYGFKPFLIIECMREKGHVLESAMAGVLASCWVSGSF